MLSQGGCDAAAKAASCMLFIGAFDSSAHKMPAMSGDNKLAVLPGAYAPDFLAELVGPGPSCPPQECQNHLAHEVPLQTACQRLQHGLQAA